MEKENEKVNILLHGYISNIKSKIITKLRIGYII